MESIGLNQGKIDRNSPDSVRIPQYLCQDKSGLWFGEFERYRLRSAFQAIYRRADAGTLCLEGFEGLVRVNASGPEVQSEQFFADVDPEQLFIVDRICRAIHFRNFALSGGGSLRIFLNMFPMTYQQFIDSDYDFRETPKRLARFGLTPKQAVFEIVESESTDFGVLKSLVELCREFGVSIALDDFGTKYSNVDRMIGLRPDIVKLDCALLRHAANRPEVASLVRSLVKMAVDYGAEVVIEGIESYEELEFALSTEAVMFQGFLLDSPGIRLTLVPRRLAVEELRQLTGT